jgi:hypothetical protein
MGQVPSLKAIGCKRAHRKSWPCKIQTAFPDSTIANVRNISLKSVTLEPV